MRSTTQTPNGFSGSRNATIVRSRSWSRWTHFPNLDNLVLLCGYHHRERHCDDALARARHKRERPIHAAQAYGTSSRNALLVHVVVRTEELGLTLGRMILVEPSHRRGVGAVDELFGMREVDRGNG
jgi:hypothetical protein